MPFLSDARGPDDLRLYAIGDVHGRLDLLRAAHGRIAADITRRPCRAFRVIHLGDYIDRGPDSAGVVSHLIEVCRDGDGVCLAGNHDLLAPSFLRNPGESADFWLTWGGDATLRSYGVDVDAPELAGKPWREVRDVFEAALPESHARFFDTLKFHESHGDFLFVHAGVRPGVRVEKQTPSDVTMIREPFLSDERDHGCVVVHGHTITETPDVRPNRIGIDTGAWRTGRLTTLVIDGPRKAFLDEAGYVPIG